MSFYNFHLIFIARVIKLWKTKTEFKYLRIKKWRNAVVRNFPLWFFSWLFQYLWWENMILKKYILENILRYTYNTSLHVIIWTRWTLHDALCAKKDTWVRICSSNWVTWNVFFNRQQAEELCYKVGLRWKKKQRLWQ